ncbi:S-adenosyl-L-methionine-dependent methyltransferase [Rickenella mellea]|uniref:S-adenosyl-L-methionine-dependent methyltransferase n=1 Tax=Rickenella mellea TaxID=50990 RepID=A0A4Y7QFH2_9AGAM|nr:S-adenosyl-L-methionine-dependent methyltransferase [Rickenella mellea]
MSEFTFTGSEDDDVLSGSNETADRQRTQVDDIDAQSNATSVYSFKSSRDGHTLFRLVQGRPFNAQNELYFLPADAIEFQRMERNHLMQLVFLGRLYIEPEKVQRVLRPTPGEQKRILDLGAGSGSWCIAMAHEFPLAEVIGVDLAPNTSCVPPPNCRFEFDDFNRGLPHYYGLFDIVHCRSVANGVKDFSWFISECAKCLKPGGMLLVTEGHQDILNSEKQLQARAYGSGGPGQSWLARAVFESCNIMKRRGSSVDGRGMLYELMTSCRLLDGVGEKVGYMPIGPWERGSTPDDDQRKQILGILTRQVLKELVRSLEPLFISERFPRRLIQQFVDGTAEELNELKEHMYARFFYAYGTRNSEGFH